MKFIGLVLTVFIGVAIGKALGFSDTGICIGSVIGAGTFIITTLEK